MDLLWRKKEERKTYVVTEKAKGVQEAILDYSMLESANNLSLVRIHLITGRTHQIRAQFSSRQLPLVGDRKYSLNEDPCEIALWSASLSFRHPLTGQTMHFDAKPDPGFPWDQFEVLK